MYYNELSKADRAGIYDAITNYLMDNQEYSYDDVEEVKPHLEWAYVGMINGYISDCPGFAGDIFLIAFGAGPECNFVITKAYKTNGELDYRVASSSTI